MPNVLAERNGAVLTITIHRPERLNALDEATMAELRMALEAATEARDVRAVLLTGAGSAFCAGGDVAAMEAHRADGTLPDLFHRLTSAQEHIVREILEMPKPVVAALPGVAAGGGLSLALAADWRIASNTAVLVPAFLQLGTVQPVRVGGALLMADVSPGQILAWPISVSISKTDPATNIVVQVMGMTESPDGVHEELAVSDDTGPFSARSFISIDNSSFHFWIRVLRRR